MRHANKAIHSTSNKHWAVSQIIGLILSSFATLAAADSHITQVTVYPGSATIERATSVANGAQSVIFDCLPANTNVQSLQLKADADVRLGEIRIDSRERALSDACPASTNGNSTTDLKNQRAQLQAQFDSLSLVTGYLKSFAAEDSSKASSTNINATSDAIFKNANDAYIKQSKIQQRIEAIDRELAATQTGRYNPPEQTRIMQVTASIFAPRTTDVRLSYQVNGPSWSPAYRAVLDTQTSQLKIERQALVSQATGEDWQQAKLVLSTGQPRANALAPTPNSWQFDIYQPPPVSVEDGAFKERKSMPPMPVLPAPIMANRERGYNDEIIISNNDYNTTFNIPKTVSVPSNGQKIAFALGEFKTDSQLIVRTTPAIDARAYLIAETTAPEGVWPAGPIQLYRDNDFVGTSRWDVSLDNKLSLSFGQDELVRVEVAPDLDKTNAGDRSSKQEQKYAHSYTIRNKHSKNITLQVLEATPVAINSNIKVMTKFTPEPNETDWNRRAGVILWEKELNAGDVMRFDANYTVSSPKDTQIIQR